jgi:hypothetical protein
MSPAKLPDHWRDRAKDLRRFSPSAAEAFDAAADELQASLAQQQAELLTLEEASRESGYSADHLGVLIKEGKIENLGRKHAPRIRRRDLPRKPRPASATPIGSKSGGPTLAGITRDAINSRSSRR